VPPSPASQRVHELRPQDLAGSPPLEAAREILGRAIDGRYLLVWFAEVEINFLCRIFGGRARRWAARCVDVRNLAIEAEAAGREARDRPGYSLTSTARRYGVPVAEPHQALDDALVTAQLFLMLSGEAAGRSPAVGAADPRGRTSVAHNLNNDSTSRYNGRAGRSRPRRRARGGTVSDPIRGAFTDIQAAMGATFVDEGGWLWTGGFGDPEGEYAAVREGVGMWDLSPLNKWEFRGPDAVEAVQRVHSNDVLRMADGQVRYGALLDEDGLLVDDGTVFRFAGDHLWVMTNDMNRQAYFEDAAKGLDSRSSTWARTCRACRSRGRGRATSCARSPTPTWTRCGTSGSSPSR